MKARPRVVSAPLTSPRPIARQASSRRDREGLPLPHERDESTGQTADEPDPKMRQAYEDITAGLVDTDMRATPGLDARRRRALLHRRG